jgi:hypothetical protein
MDDVHRATRAERHIAAVLILALSLAAAVSHWLVLEGRYAQPDEEIARAVVSRVLVTGNSDTNWARTDVVSAFRYNQFNFSSYYLAAAWVERGLGRTKADVDDQAALRLHLRQQSCVLGGFVVLLAGLLGLRLSAPIAGVAAALLTAACVTLFQDCIYARPEVFVTLLTLLFVHVSISLSIGRGLVLFATGLLVGILLAAKVTFAALLPFPLMILAVRLAPLGRSSLLSAWPGLLGYSLMYIIAVGAGFALGAPYAIAAPWQYAQGIEALLRQYSAGYWPHGVPDASLPGRFSNGLRYLVYTLGAPCLVLALAALAVQFRRRNGQVVLAMAGPLLTLLFFLQTPVFFERNFSHALPIVFVLCGIGLALLGEFMRKSLPTKPPLLPALAVVAVLVLTAYPPLAVSARLFNLLRLDDYLPKVEAEQQRISNHGALSVFAVPTVSTDISAIPKMRGGLCGHVIYQVMDYGDLYTQRQLAAFLALGYRLESRVVGPFSGAPPSTLNTYHATDVVFLSSPRDNSDASCKADLVTLESQHDYAEIKTDVSMSTAWQQNAFPPDMDIGTWRSPLFASWGGHDANVGELAMGPFSVCGVVIVPFATGPDTTGSELSIERLSNGGHTTIFAGTPPPVQAWSAIRVRSSGDCATYYVRAVDHGTGWGQWLAVGVPVRAAARQ